MLKTLGHVYRVVENKIKHRKYIKLEFFPIVLKLTAKTLEYVKLLALGMGYEDSLTGFQSMLFYSRAP